VSLLSDMTNAFMSVSYGNQEPDILRCTTATAKRIHAAIRENDVANLRTHTVPLGYKWTDETFLSARFVLDDSLPDGLVRFENTRIHKDSENAERFTCELRLS
jgi:hypothetical protein